MSALVLDAGAFVAADRADRAVHARLRMAEQGGLDLRSTGVVISQVWRDPSGRQADLARLLRSVDVQAVDQQLGTRGRGPPRSSRHPGRSRRHRRGHQSHRRPHP